MRFTLGNMFLAVAMLSLACAGLMYRTELWCEIVVAASLLLFVSQFIRGVSASSTERVARITFAAIGVAYLLAVFSSRLCQVLITNRLLSFLWQNFNASAVDVKRPADWLFQLLERTPDAPLKPFEESVLSFLVIGHCIFSWLFAALAAWFAGRIYDRRERGTATPT